MTNTKRKLVETKKPPPNTTSAKRVRGIAIERLSKACAKKVRDNSEKIAESLFDHTLEGNVNCAKLLVSLIKEEEPRKTPDGIGPGSSLALELAAEPQCEGPEDDTEDPFSQLGDERG